MFHPNIDRLSVSIEKLFESRQSGAFYDELLTDKEVAHIMKVSRRTLQDYRNNGIFSYIQVGSKILHLNDATPKQSQVIYYKLLGYKESEIAEKMKIYQSGVNNHSSSAKWYCIEEALNNFEQIKFEDYE